MPHLLLQLENAIHQRLTRGRTAGHIDIDRHNPVTAPRHTVGIMVIAASIRTAAHGNDPSRIGHLIVDLAEGRRHFVGEGAGDNHDVGLAG